MPGKVNPVLPEAVTQVAAQVIGNDAAVAFAGSQGNFELNVYMPMMARNLLESIGLLANVSRLFADRCVDGIEADVERCRAYAESSPVDRPRRSTRTSATRRRPSSSRRAARPARSIRELVRRAGAS